jgi:sarcosine oxidase subunit delta
MLLITCPYCGERPELEFTHGGQAHIARPQKPAEVEAQAWVSFLYLRENTKGLYAERWRHTHGCGRFFNAVRDTTTDHFVAIYRMGEVPPPAVQARLRAQPVPPVADSAKGRS